MDMLHHLTGTQIPGIPCCQTFSGDIDQRTNQLLRQHEAMLAFLRWDLHTHIHCYTAAACLTNSCHNNKGTLSLAFKCEPSELCNHVADLMKWVTQVS